MSGRDDSSSKILETARRHFLERSYHGATLRDIARDAGVTTGSLYHHFAGKDELFVEVCVEGLKNLLRRLRTAAQLTEGRPLSERVVALFDAYVAFYIEERGYFELVRRLQTQPKTLNMGPELAARLESVSDEIVDVMIGLLAQAEPELTPEEQRRRVLFTVAMAEGLVSCERRGLLARFDLSLASFRSTIIAMAENIVSRH